MGDLVRWVDNGVECWSLSPRDKQAVVLDYGRRYDIHHFVETGTYLGDMVEAVRERFLTVLSIELSWSYYRKAADRFRAFPNVTVVHADSSIFLRSYLGPITAGVATLFWLDAHCSGGDTVGGVHLIAEELTAIFDSGVEGVILVDDCQHFWKNGVPERAIDVIKKYPGWKYEVEDGIMRIFKEGK